MGRKKNSEKSLIKTEEVLNKTAKDIENDINVVNENIGENLEKVKGKAEEIIKIEETTEDMKNTEEKKKKVKKSSIEKEKNKGQDAPKETPISNDKKAKIAALKEKAKELEKAIEKEQDIKQKVKAEEEADMLVPIEDYLKSSIHLGTRVITPDMKRYVYKRRADGLAVFNTTLLDKMIREAADFISKYAPKDMIIVCKREAGWKAVELFSKTTGIRSFTKKYPAGILTNPNLEDFMETEMVMICDPWIDKNALEDAKKIKIPALAICDTNNYAPNITKILPGNNKSPKSLGFILYLLSKLYIEKRKMNVNVPPISEWVDGWDSLVPPK